MNWRHERACWCIIINIFIHSLSCLLFFIYWNYWGFMILTGELIHEEKKSFKFFFCIFFLDDKFLQAVKLHLCKPEKWCKFIHLWNLTSVLSLYSFLWMILDLLKLNFVWEMINGSKWWSIEFNESKLM